MRVSKIIFLRTRFSKEPSTLCKVMFEILLFLVIKPMLAILNVDSLSVISMERLPK